EVLQKVIIEEEKPRAFFRTGMLIEQGDQMVQTALYQRGEGPYDNPVHFFTRNFCGINSICIHRDCFKEDRFDTRFVLFPDTHLILRILARYPFYQLPVYTCVCRQHSGRVSHATYLAADIEQKVLNNIAAIKSVFEEYEPLISPFVPATAKAYMLSEKYVNHANGALLSRRFQLSLKYIFKAMQLDQQAWFWWYYIKFFLKLPFKWLTDYPGPLYRS
ncbi:MAG: hypothetical protein AAFP19_13815, partial [Bacteroidota bacterium]